MLFTSLIRNIIQFKDGGINIGLTAIFLLVIANIATASLCDTNILLIQPPHFFLWNYRFCYSHYYNTSINLLQLSLRNMGFSGIFPKC